MESDDLLCSRNARLKKALVGRAQWKINQPHPLRENKQALMDHLQPRSTGAVEDQARPLLWKRKTSKLERIIGKNVSTLPQAYD